MTTVEIVVPHGPGLRVDPRSEQAQRLREAHAAALVRLAAALKDGVTRWRTLEVTDRHRKSAYLIASRRGGYRVGWFDSLGPRGHTDFGPDEWNKLAEDILRQLQPDAGQPQTTVRLLPPSRSLVEFWLAQPKGQWGLATVQLIAQSNALRAKDQYEEAARLEREARQRLGPMPPESPLPDTIGSPQPARPPGVREYLTGLGWGGGPDRLLGWGRQGEAWLLKDGTVAKVSRDRFEASCLRELAGRQPVSRHLPRILDVRFDMPAGLMWAGRAGEGTEYDDHPVVAYRREALADLPGDPWQFTGKLNREVEDIAVKDGLQLTDWDVSINWGQRADGTIVYRDLACQPVPGRSARAEVPDSAEYAKALERHAARQQQQRPNSGQTTGGRKRLTGAAAASRLRRLAKNPKAVVEVKVRRVDPVELLRGPLLPEDPEWPTPTDKRSVRVLMERLPARLQVRCAIEAARLVLPVFEAAVPGDQRPRQAIELVERWLAGEEVSQGQLWEAARDAASAAAHAAQAADATYDTAAVYAIYAAAHATVVTAALARAAAHATVVAAAARVAEAAAYATRAATPARPADYSIETQTRFYRLWWSNCRRVLAFADVRTADVQTVSGANRGYDQATGLETPGPSVSDYLRDGTSATIGRIRDLTDPSRVIALRIVQVQKGRTAGELQVEFVEQQDGKRKSYRLSFANLGRGTPAARIAADVETYLNFELAQPNWKVELDPLGKPRKEQPVPKLPRPKAPPGGDFPSPSRPEITVAEHIVLLKETRFLTYPQAQLLERLSRLARMEPDRFTPGMGVRWQVGGLGRPQWNRGYRVVQVDGPNRMAEIMQVADTGLTESGGDDPHLIGRRYPVSFMWLVRDRQYDAPGV